MDQLRGGGSPSMSGIRSQKQKVEKVPTTNKGQTHLFQVFSNSANPKGREPQRLINYIRQKRTQPLPQRLIDYPQEAHYPNWLSSVVLVKKPNDKWRMFVNFTKLNKAHPKDSFLLSRIDQIFELTIGHYMLSLMDAYQSKYSHICMN